MPITHLKALLLGEISFGVQGRRLSRLLKHLRLPVVLSVVVVVVMLVVVVVMLVVLVVVAVAVVMVMVAVVMVLVVVHREGSAQGARQGQTSGYGSR